MTTAVTVRMYNVGFGDAFLVTVDADGKPWRMLVDCGVHSQGQARPIRETVRAIIGDLASAGVDGTPHLDVVVATHHHADHISGFALDEWEQVHVDEVWLPFVEDSRDADALALRRAQTEAARRLTALLGRRTAGLEPGSWPAAVAEASGFAMNSFGNAEATDRLIGRNGKHFAGAHRVRYLPRTAPRKNRIPVADGVATAHVLGPSRDPKDLKCMDPPANAGWLRLDEALDEDDLFHDSALADAPLFDPRYAVQDVAQLPTRLSDAQGSLKLRTVNNDAGLLGAASILERSVNNTSLFIVLDVGGKRLVFPGDSQEGAWQHVLRDAEKAELLRDAVFYKVGHHGSHNATPKSFVNDVWRDGGYAMLPWGLVNRWKDSIPKVELLDALHSHHHTVVRADAPEAVPGKVTVHEDVWSEVVFSV
jgi:beta-lactamase superfamily II metal-dependent hydrolase